MTALPWLQNTAPADFVLDAAHAFDLLTIICVVLIAGLISARCEESAQAVASVRLAGIC